MKKIKLGDIATSQTGPFGSQLHEEDYVKQGIPIVTVEHLGELGFTTQNLPFVSEEDVIRLNKYILKEGDIVFSRVGAIDRNTYTTSDEEGWLFSGRCIRVRCNREKVNPLYLSYYFRLPEFKKMMLNISVGATMPSLNTELMNNLPLYLLDRSEQDLVADFLNKFDSKIRLNNKIIHELEQMSKTLFDYWFLQFDFPNKEGKPYKTSGGKMVWNEDLKREIPDGWQVKKIGNLIVENEKSKIQVNAATTKGNIPFFTSGDDVIYVNNFLVDGLNMFLNTGGNAGLKYYFGKASYSTDTWCISGNDNSSCYLIGYLENLIPYMDVKFFAGTGLKHLQKELLKQELLVYPDSYSLKKYTDIAMANYKKIALLKKENQELASLRDFLLPLLMNGQVTITK